MSMRDYKNITDNNNLSFANIKEMLTSICEGKTELYEKHLSEQVVIDANGIDAPEHVDVESLQNYAETLTLGEEKVHFDYIGENKVVPYETQGFFLNPFKTSALALEHISNDIREGKFPNTYIHPQTTIREGDKSFLNIACSELDELMLSSELSENNTVKEFVRRGFEKTLREKFDIPEELFVGTINSLISGVPLNQKLSELKNFEELQQIQENRKEYIAEFKQPIQNAVSQFSNSFMKMVDSPFISESGNLSRKMFRHVQQINAIIESIKDDRYDEARDELSSLTEEDISPINGVSLRYGDNIYNLNSRLSSVKMASDLFHEGSDMNPPIRFSVKESNSKRIALFPGSFKPPHKGHFAVAEQLARTKGIDEVRVLISPLPRSNADQTCSITAEQSLNVWKKLAEGYKNIKPVISKTNSPVSSVYQSLKEGKPHENYVLVVGDKDNASRYSGIDQFIQENNPKVRAEIYTSRASGEDRNISATDMREAIGKGDKEAFTTFMPEIDKSITKEVWSMLTTVNEMSAMAGGSVEGGTTKRKQKTMFRESIDRLQIFESIDKVEVLVYPRKRLVEATDIEDSPHASTGINVLRDLLKKIVPQVETDYKTLTTSQEQRDSYRAHLLKAIHMSLERAGVTAAADDGTDMMAPEDQLMEMISRDSVIDEADLELKIDEPASQQDKDEKFIDIDGKNQQDDQEEEDNFSITGKDKTGRNMAQSTFDSIENTILDSYVILSDPEDKKMFEDYLMANLKLYMERFESEMETTVSEPTAGDDAAQNTTDSAGIGGEEEPAGGLDLGV